MLRCVFSFVDFSRSQCCMRSGWRSWTCSRQKHFSAISEFKMGLEIRVVMKFITGTIDCRSTAANLPHLSRMSDVVKSICDQLQIFIGSNRWEKSLVIPSIGLYWTFWLSYRWAVECLRPNSETSNSFPWENLSSQPRVYNMIIQLLSDARTRYSLHGQFLIK